MMEIGKLGFDGRSSPDGRLRTSTDGKVSDKDKIGGAAGAKKGDQRSDIMAQAKI